jgi:hypothetical protein
MRSKAATDSEIAALAAAQHGVYAVGHTVLKREGRWMAATLATGGVLSHRTAAAAWGFSTSDGAIHVTVPGDPGRHRRPGLKIHRSRTLTLDDTTVLDGIPITEPHRTLNDLARTLSGRPLEHALNLAERHIDFDRLKRSAPPSLQAVLADYTTPPDSRTTAPGTSSSRCAGGGSCASLRARSTTARSGWHGRFG